MSCWYFPTFKLLNCFHFAYSPPPYPFKCRSSLNRLSMISISTKYSWMSFTNTSTPFNCKSTKSVGAQLIHVYMLSFQRNIRVAMTVRTRICNIYECKIYTYLFHLCYMHCQLRRWTFVARLHRFLLLKSAFLWIVHPINFFLNSFTLFKKKKFKRNNFSKEEVRKKDVLSQLLLQGTSSSG